MTIITIQKLLKKIRQADRCTIMSPLSLVVAELAQELDLLEDDGQRRQMLQVGVVGDLHFALRDRVH